MREFRAIGTSAGVGFQVLLHYLGVVKRQLDIAAGTTANDAASSVLFYVLDQVDMFLLL